MSLKPSWKNRRRVVFGTLAYCAVLVAYIVISGNDTRLNETAVTGLLVLAGSVVGSYVFGAVWNDKNIMQNLGSEPYEDEYSGGYGPRMPPPPKRMT